ncbi:hypothetical protein GCM10008026_12970 [Chelatococcus composti]|nr:hypothetical protein GCM10008026_12970 [Chelatococcus composti]
MLVMISRPRFMPLAADGCGSAAIPSGSARADLRSGVSRPPLEVWLARIDAPVMVYYSRSLRQNKNIPHLTGERWQP